VLLIFSWKKFGQGLRFYTIITKDKRGVIFMLKFKNEQIASLYNQFSINVFNAGLCKENQLTYGYINENKQEELRIETSDGNAYFDSFGELQEATGCFEPYLSFDSSITALDNFNKGHHIKN